MMGDRYVVRSKSEKFYQSVGDGVDIPFTATQFDELSKAECVAKCEKGAVYKLEAKPVFKPKKAVFPLVLVLAIGFFVNEFRKENVIRDQAGLTERAGAMTRSPKASH
jgi:hypothetical protein